MKRSSLFILLTAGVLALAGASCSNTNAGQQQPSGDAVQQKSQTMPSGDAVEQSATIPTPDGSPVYTLDEVAAHATADDCWMAIHGNVYDVTSFIPRHPGGQAILEGCGKDATTLFETRPMGSGTPHSDRARDMMAQYQIGTLAQ